MLIPSRLQATPWKTAVLLRVMVCSLFVLIAPRAHASGTFVNPLNTSADPWMQYHNGYYYLATTQGSSIKIWKAASISGLLTASPTTVWTECCNVWAAEFHLLNGPNGLRWYLYYTKDDGIDVNHRMYVLESSGTDPLGPYTDKGRIATDPNNQYYAIDGSVLRKSDGSLYFLWAGHPGHLLYIAPMSNPWTISGGRVNLPASGFGCTEVREGPVVLQRNGRIFLTYSACDTGKPDYRLGMLTANESSNVMDPASWTQTAVPVFQRNDANGAFGPGHHGFFKSPDGTEDWIIYHAKTTAEYTYNGRTTRAQRITWNADGTPNLGIPVSVGATLTKPSGDNGPSPITLNDNATGTGLQQFEYTGNWSYGPSCGVGCYQGDDHYSNTANASVQVRFNGTRIVLYGAKDPSHGIGAVSIDGGPETLVDFYQSPRQGHQVMYISPVLSPGPHTLKLRVTGTKNGASGGYYLTIDRVDISASATDATRYEAEHAQLTNARVATIASASNGQKAGYIDYADSAVRFTVNVPKAGTHAVTVRYGNGWGASSHNVSVNGGAPFSVNYANNGVDVWTSLTLQVPLNAGNNTITFTKGSNFTELDYLELPRYEAENATISHAAIASQASASNGQKVGYIDYADSFVEFRVNVPSSGTYTLRTLYSNGWGSSSHNISVNGGAPFSQSYANNGVDVWTAATTTVNLNAGTNTIRFTKGAQFTELDYIEVYR